MKDNSTYYYQTFLLYIDDILAIIQNPENFIRHELGKIFFVKPNSIRPPTQYLVNKVLYVNLDHFQSACRFSSSQYVQYNFT